MDPVQMCVSVHSNAARYKVLWTRRVNFKWYPLTANHLCYTYHMIHMVATPYSKQSFPAQAYTYAWHCIVLNVETCTSP